jgi:hypothetical protein
MALNTLQSMIFFGHLVQKLNLELIAGYTCCIRADFNFFEAALLYDRSATFEDDHHFALL